MSRCAERETIYIPLYVQPTWQMMRRSLTLSAALPLGSNQQQNGHGTEWEMGRKGEEEGLGEMSQHSSTIPVEEKRKAIHNQVIQKWFFSPVIHQGRRKEEEGTVSLSLYLRNSTTEIWSNRMKTRRGIMMKSFFLSTPLLLPRHWWVLREFCFRFLRYWSRLL